MPKRRDDAPSIALRAAAVADAAQIRAWDEKPHVIEAGGAWYEFDWAAEIARDVDWREFRIAELDGRAIGVVQIIDPAREETGYWGDVAPNLRAIDIWIGEEDCLGRGFGTQMMRAALDRCFASGADAVLIDPLARNTRAHRFYERFGFRFVERRLFDEDDCFVYKLNSKEWRK
ncbi:MAG: GNAT family N-acetyltransferase [Pseudomonadota bacterium]